MTQPHASITIRAGHAGPGQGRDNRTAPANVAGGPRGRGAGVRPIVARRAPGPGVGVLAHLASGPALHSSSPWRPSSAMGWADRFRPLVALITVSAPGDFFGVFPETTKRPAQVGTDVVVVLAGHAVVACDDHVSGVGDLLDTTGTIGDLRLYRQARASSSPCADGATHPQSRLVAISAPSAIALNLAQTIVG